MMRVIERWCARYGVLLWLFGTPLLLIWVGYLVS
jgi:hypothetical protein